MSRPGWRFVLIAVAVAVLLAAIGGGVLVTIDHRREDAAARTTDEAEAVVGAKAAVERRNPEAETIGFGDVFVRWSDGEPAVCGEVDIVEEQDSFAGAQRFVQAGGSLTLEAVDAGLEQAWREFCA